MVMELLEMHVHWKEMYEDRDRRYSVGVSSQWMEPGAPQQS